MKKYFRAFSMGITMFTAIPLPQSKWDDDSIKHVMKLYPFIGLIIGILWYASYKVLTMMGASMILTSAITMIVPFIITGMLHLDGFMDVCDALLSRREKKEKIRILKDPNTGAFAVISLAILFVIDFAAIYTVIESEKNIIGLIFIPIISRSLSAIYLLTKPAMAESSLGSYFKKGTGKIDVVIVLSCLILASFIFIVLYGGKGIVVPVTMLISSFLAINNCVKELGGVSGDSAGYSLVIAEAIGLLFLAFI